jgi:DNA polymerase-3 subunit epsilon
MDKILHIDLETTGRNHWENGIHQIACIIEIDGKTVEEFDFKVRPHPSAIIKDDALKVSNTTREQIREYDRSDIIFPKFLANISQFVDVQDPLDKFFLSGFNAASFDVPFLETWMKMHNFREWSGYFHNAVLDTQTLLGDYFRRNKIPVSSYSLSNMLKMAGMVFSPSAMHDAIYDVYLSQQILKFLANA